ITACFLSLWGVAGWLKSLECRVLSPESAVQDVPREAEAIDVPFTVSAVRRFSVFLFAWLVGVGGGAEFWYRSHEGVGAKAVTWQVEFPGESPGFRELPFTDKTKQFLRYDEGYNGAWQEGAEQRWQAVFLRWNPGRIAVHLAKSHTPEVCLTAAGKQ